MNRTLVAACVALGIVALNASEAQAIAIQYDATKADDVWQYSYSVTDFVFGANQALFIDFDSNLYSGLQAQPPAPNDDWYTTTFPTSVPAPDIDGEPPPGSFVALSLVNGASLAKPFTVTFTWLGADGTTPGSQFFSVYQLDDAGNVVLDADGNPQPAVVTGETSPVPEPATLGLTAIGIALAGGRRALRRRRNR
jgi:PEP-CTERM motif